MRSYESTCEDLMLSPKTWLITGVAGFIGSNLLEALLNLNQKVIGLDNLSTGFMDNLDEVKVSVAEHQWKNFIFYKGDISDYDLCTDVVRGVDYVLHQAALGSVPRSIANPINSNAANITGFLNVLNASKDIGVSSFTFAASSSTYGDHPSLPKVEENIGNPLSPYAVTKYVNELYADVFSKSYNFNSNGLRYFNVFGKRQNPNGDYAAVIPKWIDSVINNKEIYINGDGETSRDFCFVENVIQANILSAVSKQDGANIYNVAFGNQTSLNELIDLIISKLHKYDFKYSKAINYRDFRKGDVRHSLADISKIKKQLGYNPLFDIKTGLQKSIEWHVNKNKIS